jgi:hypothetical protein
VAELAFDCVGAKVDRYAGVPALSLVLRISETSGQRVEAIALRCQIRIEPARRRYSAAEAERLNDLFGDTERWADTLKPMQFSTVATMVPGFFGAVEFELPITFTYDLEVGSARYFDSLEAGEIPLLLLFSGTVFTVADGRIQVQQVPWSKEAAYRLPVPVWREAIDAHFPNSAWIKMRTDAGGSPALQVLPRLADLGPDAGRAARAGRRRRRGPAMTAYRSCPSGGSGVTADPAHVAHARKVADAVLYEGYVLYPYRRSAQKNRTRFQFGVLMPPPYRAIDDCEPSASQTECLVECRDDAGVDIGLRFLHLQHRTAQRIDPATGEASDVDAVLVDGTEYVSFDEAVEREQHLSGRIADLLDADTELHFDIPASEEAEEPQRPGRGAGGPAAPPLRGAGRRHRGPGRAHRRTLRCHPAAGPRGEPDGAAGPAAQPGRRPEVFTDRRAPADRRRGRQLPVADRSAGMGGRRGGRVRECRCLAGAGRPAGMP